MIMFIITIIIIATAIELSLGDSSPYTSTDSCHSVAAVLTPVQTKQTIHKHSTNNTKHSKHKYTILPKHTTHYTTPPTHTHTHTPTQYNTI
jgi:hypothetical protein